MSTDEYDQDADELRNAQTIQMQKLHDLVLLSIKEQDSIFNNLAHPPIETLSPGQRVSDKVAQFGGSWVFIILFLSLLIAWILFNELVPNGERFDPYPFILMNLVLSCVAALQAPIIMMSQNRQAEKDRARAENDYMVNLKAELEVRSLNQKIDLLQEEQLKTIFSVQARQMEILKRMENNIQVLMAKNK
ncbi:uncharacterized protein DUF1003 [Dyadobacter jejuensis]|uniref:Uncharacterized protein DUF1003 n=1 Tax=Dyadobacter jejuensis TaxID=1082580 RepID=A0A316APL4_9BACT|nr:DUF1003 domain-containing protein [Dyadobacter jejuensis]PWJ59431.1 uncharacterized protein DUF1003 [Dyadobacter jejuensis]